MILDLFSKRLRRSRGQMPDVYKYDEVAPKLRAQVVHIVEDLLSRARHDAIVVYEQLHDLLARELGVFRLQPDNYRNEKSTDYLNYFLKVKEAESALDWIELTFRGASMAHNREDYYRYAETCLGAKTTVEAAVEELNQRFREAGVGYQFESGEIIRVDSQYLHTEAVKPTLALLSERRFKAAEKEFLTAHEAYRNGKHETALVEALKSFESVLKVILTGRKWAFRDGATATNLLDVAFANELIPSYLQTHFGALRSTLAAGGPTVRNKAGAHGAGTVPREVPAHLASYVLHLTASSILLLVEADRALK